MKKIALIAGALIALSASIASAQGINLSWNDCGAAGVQNVNFACNVNTGASFIVYGSYLPPASASLLAGISSTIDYVSDQNTLPAWWQFGNDWPTGTTPGCRSTAMVGSFDFSANSSCFDYYTSVGASAAGAILAGYTANGQPAVGEVKIQAAVPLDNAAALDPANGETYAFKLIISRAKTVSTGFCDGCVHPVCLTLKDITLYYTDNNITPITNELNRAWVTFNGPSSGATCPQSTPTKSRTWGELKSLYR